ncbi:hypothetical protein ACGFSI_04615 [Streptomyces virginiae]|uniref:hypothetical protein n=1 Tax=Streptomyces virginiae TaxID=1961 RepID=UPI003715ED4C
MDSEVRWEIRTTASYLVLDGRVWTRFLTKSDTPPADADVAGLALKDKTADATESRLNAPAGRHVDRDVRENEYVRVFHGHLTWGGSRRVKRVVRFDHSAWRGILFRPIGQVRASYGRLLKLLG